MPALSQIKLSMHLPRPSTAIRCLALASLCFAAGLPLALAAAPATAPSAAPAAAAISAGPLPAVPVRKKTPAAPVKLIDLNSASRDELKKLPGVGDAEADKIIAARPLLTKAELVTRDIIGAGPYVSLKHLVVAMQKPQKPQKAQNSPLPATQAAQPKPGGKGG